MRTRSYEYWEIRNGWDDDAVTLKRGNEEHCRRFLQSIANRVENTGENLYLVRITLVQAIKADKK